MNHFFAHHFDALFFDDFAALFFYDFAALFFEDFTGVFLADFTGVFLADFAGAFLADFTGVFLADFTICFVLVPLLADGFEALFSTVLIGVIGWTGVDTTTLTADNFWALFAGDEALLAFEEDFLAEELLLLAGVFLFAD